MMTISKKQYLDAIRASSAYPLYRGVINTITYLFYAIAAVCLLGAVIGGFSLMIRSFMAGLGIVVLGGIFAALNFFFGQLFKETSLMLVDIGDSIVDANSRVH